MLHLTYYNYDGVGKRNQAKFKYSQAVRVGDRIECSGQGRSTLDPRAPSPLPREAVKSQGKETHPTLRTKPPEKTEEKSYFV